MVAVPRRTPDRRVAHRPRDHRDADQGAVSDGLGEVVRVLPASAGRHSRTVKAVGVRSFPEQRGRMVETAEDGGEVGRWYGAGLEDSRIRAGGVFIGAGLLSGGLDRIGV